MNLSLSTIATKKSLSEFLLLKHSIELFHDCQWCVVADSTTESVLRSLDNVSVVEVFSTDDSKLSHGVTDVTMKSYHYDLMLAKFSATKAALSENGWAVYLDADMLFVNPIDDYVFRLLKDSDVDAVLTPHYTNDKPNEMRVGIFNAGMFGVSNPEFLEKWHEYCIVHRDKSTYFEQQPIEFIYKIFRCLTLPINYNIGWWRFKDGFSDHRFDYISLDEKGGLMFYGLPAINFHFHLMKPLLYPNNGQRLIQNVIDLMSSSSLQSLKSIVEKYEDLKSGM
ncbi:hypothetical protein SAMN05444414_105183 [Roseovarius marisflavi]|uniref:Nucleotide-diphospho-sugar transferase n=1 Tax=Roseovarius marisflavi TaxID=1054996 RepID=A0A1M6Y450_9RHOB|nr:hypothetical protein [Roseovarius marisflavi]SHL12859.1 hypothetical protein SAMN05444414_105183 [Roseovarius marisflavi]